MGENGGKLASEILSDIIVHMKYAKYLPVKYRRETYKEIIDRNKAMHTNKFPHLKNEIDEAYALVYEKKILPSMRALEDNTLIPYNGGWKLAKDVQKGDILYDSQGNETIVKDTVHFSDKQLYKLTFSDGASLTACAEHLWIISTLDDIAQMKTRIVDTGYIQKHILQGGRHNITVWNTLPIKRVEKEFFVDPYIMGHWLGNGYSSGYQTSSSVEDSAFFAEEYLKAGYKMVHSNSSNIWAWSVHDLKKDLEKYNLINNKHFPAEYLYGSIEQRIAIVQGLMDTDGNITEAGRCSFANTNISIINGMKELLSSLGIKYIVTSRSGEVKHSSLYTILYFTNIPVFRLPRKLAKVRNIQSKRTSSRKVISVENVGKGNATCFHVDSPDHSFLAGEQMIVTHNSLQFSGKAIEVNNLRLYNCSFLPMDDARAFSELAFLLLSGVGVGISVQKHHVRKLPLVLGAQVPIGRQHRKRFLISDDIEGWADAVKILMESYFYGEREIDFDFRGIREKGALLKTSGGKAPGSAPLEVCLVNVNTVLKNAVATRGIGTQLLPIEVFDICCYIADMVLSGGQRRSALLTLFSLDDNDMLECKFGNWWEKNPQRGRSNNSALLLRSQITKPVFDELWKKIEASGCGEPGIMFSDSSDWGANPCFTGDMQLLTSTGYQRFDILNGNEVNIIDGDGNCVLGRVWYSGNKDTIKLYLSDNSFITCTPNHKFYIPVDNAWVEAKDTVGKRLSIDTSFAYSRNNTYEKYGFIQGDGNLTRLTSPVHLGMEINIGMKDDDILELFGVHRENNERAFYLRGFNEPMKDAGFCAKVLPERLFPMEFYNSIEDKASFLRGLYSANGSVIRGHRIAFKTTCKALADDLLFVLSRDFDIKGYITTNKVKKVTFSNGEYACKESYDVNISTFTGVLSFIKHIGFIQKYKMADLVMLANCKAPMVLHISENGIQAVFDFTVNTTHSGWVKGNGNTGVLSHNCCEISLQGNELCNLVEIDSSTVVSQEDFEYRAKMASRIATIQATYTDFHYLREVWRDTVEKEALIGVSLTGIASGTVMKLDMKKAADAVAEENARMADILGINHSARNTCVKPSGTASLLLGTSSGIHAWYAPYYWRRISVWKEEPIYAYLKEHHPELLEDDYFKPTTMAKIKIPMKAPEGAALRYEPALATLDRVKKVQETWISAGHITGLNKNNVSTTISVRPTEWRDVGEWMWDNRNSYTGIAVLPYDGGTYIQSPFEECTKEEYEKALTYLRKVDLSLVFEEDDATKIQEEMACSGGACEIK